MTAEQERSRLYRERIYAKYVATKFGDTMPGSISDLATRQPILISVVKRYFPQDRGAAILDLGCGHGALLYFARELGYANIRGVDRSREQVVLAEKLGIKGVSEGDALAELAAASEESFDAIVTIDLIEHYTKPEFIELVDAVFRALKPGGRWIIHAPNGESPFAGRVRYGDFTHELAFTCTSIGQVLAISGFGSVECHEDVPVMHGILSLVRLAIWKILRTALYVFVVAETGDWKTKHIFSQSFTAVARK